MALLSERWIVVMFGFLSIYKVASLCEVSVPGRSWPEPNLLVPLNSTVIINCTLNDNLTYWSIDLANDGADSQKQFVDNGGQRSTLNSHGVYELPPVETTLRLMITDIGNNNQSEIFCVGGMNIGSLHTTLTVYDPAALSIPVEATPSDSVLQSTTISWNPPPSLVNPDVNLTYKLFVISDNTEERTFQVDEHYSVFTAPKDAPPCEVYNFSVTATYVGAIYTGAGCSVHSPVLSTMLPSLPDIETLERSINYTVKKESGTVYLLVSFQPANYCEQYPVVNYTLEVESLESPTQPQTLQFPAEWAESPLTADNLEEDVIYSFRVIAHNSVGNVSSKAIEVYTSDVQSVRVASKGENESVFIQCTFISGSDATGCMVVFVGELTNTTVNLTRKDKEIESVINHELPFPLSCYHQVFALDIEGDGSLGTLPVPTVLGTELNTRVKCTSVKKQPLQDTSSKLLVAILIPVVLLLAAVILVGVVIIVLQIRLKHQNPSTVSLPSASPLWERNSYEDTKSFPVYAVPMKHKKLTNGVRGNGDGAEKESLEDESSATITVVTHNGTTAEIQNQTKHLDCLQEEELNNVSYKEEEPISPDPDAPPLPPPFNPESTHSPPPQPQPVYQEIDIRNRPPKLKPSEAISADSEAPALPPPYNPEWNRSPLSDPPPSQPVYQEIDIRTSPPKPKPSESPKTGPVYHDIFDLPTSSKSSSAKAADSHGVLQDSPDSTSSPHVAQKPLPVYQDIADLTTTEAPADRSGNDSSLIERAQDMCNPYHTTTVSATAAISPDSHTELINEDQQPTETAENLATNHTLKSQSHPKSIPIYQEISETGATVSDGNPGNHSNDLESSRSPQLELTATPPGHTRKPVPIYEDIGSITSEARTTNRGSADPTYSEVAPPPPLPERGTMAGSHEPSHHDTAPLLPERGLSGSPTEAALRELTPPPPLPARGTMHASRDVGSTPPLPLSNSETRDGFTDSSQLDSHSDLSPLLPERGTIGNSVEAPPPSPPAPLPLDVQTLLQPREEVQHIQAGEADSSDSHTHPGGTLV